MAEFVLKFADPRGHVKEQTMEASSPEELRDRMTQQGFLVYSVKPKGLMMGGGKKKAVNLEKFLIFNQQFVTLIRAGLPILKSLDLLGERLTDKRLGTAVTNVRDEVKTGSLLSDSFQRQGVFPPMYVTTVMAGEKSGALVEVLERYINFQRLSLSVRKKVIVSLVYPALLLVLTICLVTFLITFVVPRFAELYTSMQTQLPGPTQVLIAVGTTMSEYIVPIIATVVLGGLALRLWFRTESAKILVERIILKTPILGEIWIKYQVAQLSRVLSTLLIGGIPLLQALDTAGDSLGSRIMRLALDDVRKTVREGQSMSSSMRATNVFPSLTIDMVEVGESTGALPAMLNSAAEFFEDDVNTRMATALSLIEPAIMIFMGIFVAFVLVALYLPIFSLADQIH